MNNNKEFSILKWIVFPAISLVLSGAIAYFNLRVFGYEDGIPYAVIVLMIGLFSVVINVYTESKNRKLGIAAFVFEIFLAAALIGNAAYSLSVQRKMAVARMGDQSKTQTIEQIGKLRGARTQREALKKMDSGQSALEAFAQYEDTLFWIMVAELALFGVCAFTLFGIAKLVEPRQPALSEQEQKEREQWRIIADQRREYGEQLGAKFAHEPSRTLPSMIAPKRRVYANGRDDSASHSFKREKVDFDVRREPEFSRNPALAGNVSRDSEKRVSDEIKLISVERIGYGTSESGTTIPVNQKFRLIVRSDDGGSGYRVMVAWDVEGKEKGKGPQRYICRLSRDEWDRAQAMTLAGFAEHLLLPKHSARRPTDRVDQKQLDRIMKFIQSLMKG